MVAGEAGCVRVRANLERAATHERLDLGEGLVVEPGQVVEVSAETWKRVKSLKDERGITYLVAE